MVVFLDRLTMAKFDRLQEADVKKKSPNCQHQSLFFAKLPVSRFDNLTVPRKTEKIRQIACDSF